MLPNFAGVYTQGSCIPLTMVYLGAAGRWVVGSNVGGS